MGGRCETMPRELTNDTATIPQRHYNDTMLQDPGRPCSQDPAPAGSGPQPAATPPNSLILTYSYDTSRAAAFVKIDKTPGYSSTMAAAWSRRRDGGGVARPPSAGWLWGDSKPTAWVQR